MAKRNSNPFDLLGKGIQNLFSGFGGLFPSSSVGPNPPGFSGSGTGYIPPQRPATPPKDRKPSDRPSLSTQGGQVSTGGPQGPGGIPSSTPNPPRLGAPSNPKQRPDVPFADRMQTNFGDQLLSAGAISGNPKSKIDFGGTMLETGSPLGALALGLKNMSGAYGSSFWDILGIPGGQTNWKGFNTIAAQWLEEGYRANFDAGIKNPWGKAVNYALSKARSLVDSDLELSGGVSGDFGEGGAGGVDWNNPPAWFLDLIGQLSAPVDEPVAEEENLGPVINPQLLTQPFGF